MANVVALVGRPNVGKSTLFNRLTKARRAIVDDMPGVTRDCQYGQSEWCGRYFSVIDTGGYVVGSDDIFESEIRKRVEIAIAECTVVIFMVDAQLGLTGHDKEFAAIVRKSEKPVLVAANKLDTPDKALYANEFYALGMGDMYPLSAENGSGTGELLDAMAQCFEAEDSEERTDGLPRIALLGRPNVGKSSFLNALLGEERSIVTPEAGSTRDAIYSRYTKYGKDFIIIDTAGMRRKGKVEKGVEFYSVIRSIHALEDSDVCIIMVDAELGLAAQDMHIIGLAQRQGKSIMLMINKWDLVDSNMLHKKNFEKDIQEKIAPASYIPIMFASVLNKKRIYQVIEKALEICSWRTKKIPTSQLNDFLLGKIEATPPPVRKGKKIRIKYITQLKVTPPTFVFFCNLPQYIETPYKRFLENNIRAFFSFEGTPLRLFFRKK